MEQVIRGFAAENWLAIGVAVFLLAMVLYGHYRGFLRLAVSLVALILTLIVVRIASPHVTNFLQENTAVQHMVEDGLLKASGADNEDEKISEDQKKLPAGQRLLIENMRLPEQMKQALIENNNNEVYKLLGVDAFMDYIGAYLTRMVLNVVGSIVMFVVVYIGIRLIMRWLDLLSRLPILYGMNQIAGAVLGGVQGLLILWAACLVVTACSQSGWSQAVIAQIESSPWLMFLYHNNIFNWLMTGILNGVVGKGT